MNEIEIMKKLGVRVGHKTDAEHGTGCSVFLFDKKASAAASVLGASPASHETEILKPEKSVNEIHGILLTGGSAYGLGAASGVMRYLEERGIGYDTGVAVVPIVPAAAIYDLKYRSSSVRPEAWWGYEAAKKAAYTLPKGSIGAASGSTAGKIVGIQRATKTGFGFAYLSCDSYSIAAFVVVNPVGEIVDFSGEILAGIRDKNGFKPSEEALKEASCSQIKSGENTTLILIVTDYPLSRPKLYALASVVHDAIARRIKPSHTPFDGDTVFCVTTAPSSKTNDSHLLLKLFHTAQLAAEHAIVNAAINP